MCPPPTPSFANQYRCKVDGAAGCKWIMSIFSNNGHQRKDIPLYESSAVSSTPPTQGWRCIPGSVRDKDNHGDCSFSPTLLLRPLSSQKEITREDAQYSGRCSRHRILVKSGVGKGGVDPTLGKCDVRGLPACWCCSEPECGMHVCMRFEKNMDTDAQTYEHTRR